MLHYRVLRTAPAQGKAVRVTVSYRLLRILDRLIGYLYVALRQVLRFRLGLVIPPCERDGESEGRDDVIDLSLA